ncbi:MAG: N-acetylmuramoyl-L-alanine amidase [Campylobacterota bacterium]|nr:N-acetylmuramoyl-L-alanine amidase [Campylobacterota bacterium]
MLRLFLFIFLHVSIVFAENNSEILERADKLTKSPSKTEVFRAYNDYKNVYLRSMMHSNLKERRKALEGIVISGNKLHIDVSKYKKELKTLKKSLKTTTAKKNIKKTPKKNKIIVKEHNTLKKAQWKQGELELIFKKKLLKTDVNHFKMFGAKKGSYIYVFDIHATKDKTIFLQHKKLKAIRVAQYKNGIVRIVFESKTKINLRFKLKNNKLIINPNLGENSISKVVPKRKIKSINNTKISKGKVVVIDPGHGGKDAGATGYKKYREKDIVLKIANAVAKRLRSDGVTVYLTRTKDTFIKLRNRTKFANKKKADLFISIHANSVPKRNALKAKGIETYFLSRSRSDRSARVAAIENSKEIEDMNYFGKNNLLNFMNREKIIASNKLAIDIQRGILSKLNKHYKDIKDNGVREGPFWVLIGAQMPAVLLEVGFISHPTEATRLASKKYQKYLADGITEGIKRYFINNP